jgi:predicted nucleotide-binding protein
VPNADTRIIRRRSEVSADLDRQISVGREILTVEVMTADELQRVDGIFRAWHARNKLILGKSFSDESALDDYLPVSFYASDGQVGQLNALHKNVRVLVQNLVTLRSVLDLVDEASGAKKSLDPTLGEEIFIVHGHTHRDAVARVVERATGREAIILQEQPDVGSSTVIEKLEREALRAGYAVVILAGDDEGKLRTSHSHPQPRARQNVVAELGYFIGKLGRSRVKALYETGVELPSDFTGVTYIELDTNDAWRGKLTSELHAMGLSKP